MQEINRQIQAKELTRQTQKAYSNGIDSFMAENNGEIKQPVVTQTIEDRQNQVLETPLENSNQTEKIDLNKPAANVREAFENKPLEERTTEELKIEYRQLLRTEQEGMAKAQGFAERQEIDPEVQSGYGLLGDELKKRGVDVMQSVFLDATKASAEEGHPLRDLGASSATPNIIDKSGITNAYLLRELVAIDNLAEVGMEAENLLTKANMNISLSNEGITPAEKAQFAREKQIAIDRIKQVTKEVIKQNKKEMDANHRPSGLYGERKLTENEKNTIKEGNNKEALEKLFNRMFDRVDTRPQAEFSAAFGSIGAFEHDEFVKTFNEAIARYKEIGERPATDDNGVPIPGGLKGVEQAEKLDFFLQQFENERAAREVIHNAYYGVLAGLDTEKVSGFIDGFSSGWADLAFSKKGVTQTMHFYEQALLIVRESAGGYLKPTEVIGEMKNNTKGKVNDLTKKLLETANKNHTLFVDKKGEPIKTEDGEFQKLEPWQIDRALSFARGMSIITGRTIEIAASSILPAGSTAFSDLYAQRIISEIAPFRHAFKFSADKKYTRVLAYLMDRNRNPWTPKELIEWENMEFDKKIEVLNGLASDGKDRFFSVLNPFEIGGILSRTGWRVSADGEVNMINDLIQNAGGKAKPDKSWDKKRTDTWRKESADEAWIGTGVQIERKRGNLAKGKSKKLDDIKNFDTAVKKTRIQLGLIADRTPLRLFLNIRSVQEATLKSWKNMEEIQPNIEELVLLQEKAIQSKQPLDISKASKDTQEFVSKIREVWYGEKKQQFDKKVDKDGKRESDNWNKGEFKNFFNDLRDKDWKVPYTFGTEDVPYDEYDFEATGPRSVARRWGDMKAAAGASKASREFVEKVDLYKNQEQIVGEMRKVFDQIKGYNEDDARKFTLRLAEGVMKFYEKDFRHRLPLGIGTLMGITSGKSSAAQIAYGRGAMAWDELQSNEFTRLLRDNGMITVEEQQKLQKKAGGGKKEVAWSYARTVLPLLALALAYYLYTQVIEEEKKR